ncbi:RNase adapter RapZ [Halodurantibacterium flavum]|uniref:RNase adapter RapZ n=1 Tax=Halodurantibacterium flavum TaxID=1382802 RepID=A0ABW4S1J1_9RHOB
MPADEATAPMSPGPHDPIPKAPDIAPATPDRCEPVTADPRAAQRLVLVTGPSGAGRSTAINALEDLGYEVIDNLPLSLVPRLLEGPPLSRPLALGIDVRNRDFSTDALTEMIGILTRHPGIAPEVLYLDCAPETLIRRYSETRRRHPLAPVEQPALGIGREIELLAPLRDRADVLIDTTGLSPHDLRAEMARWFDHGATARLAVSVHSFSYKRGVPAGVDVVFDCRFLQNPYWVEALRPLDGRDPQVGAYVGADPRFAEFFDRVAGLTGLMLPAQLQEGRTHVAIAFGCTGGQHRSVFLTEKLAATLAEAGWQVSKRHRELERRVSAPGALTGGKA